MILGGRFSRGENPQAKPCHDFDRTRNRSSSHLKLVFDMVEKSGENHKTPSKAQVIFGPKSPWNVRNL